MPEKDTPKTGRPKGAKTKAGQNAAGAGAPAKYAAPVTLSFRVERETRQKFQRLAKGHGDLNAHLSRALEEYLAKPEIQRQLAAQDAG